MEVVGDVIGGLNVKETIKDRSLRGIKRTEIVDQSLTEQQPVTTTKKTKTRKRPPKQRQKGSSGGDIFSD